MFGRITHQQRPKRAIPPSAHRTEANVRANQMLHKADALIKSGDLSGAIGILREARKAYPRNLYVQAMEEHAADLLAAQAVQQKETERENDEKQNREDRRAESRKHEEEKANEQPGEQRENERRNAEITQQSRTAGITIPEPTRPTCPPQSPPDTTPDPPTSSPQTDVPLPIPAGAGHGGPRPTRQRMITSAPVAPLHPTVLVIDDDCSLLRIISRVLSDFGFQPVPFETTDDAFIWLRDHVPDAIVCDVNLETSTLGGFSFFETVRKDEKFALVPFIFLSGLVDDVIVRTGKQLGADDYLCKPVSEELLVATLKGKIERYRQIAAERRTAVH